VIDIDGNLTGVRVEQVGEVDLQRLGDLAGHLTPETVLVRGQERIGFETKRTVTPKMTASLRSAIESIPLDRAYVVHAGAHASPSPAGWWQ
jgi:hypothetical protein